MVDNKRAKQAANRWHLVNVLAVGLVKMENQIWPSYKFLRSVLANMKLKSTRSDFAAFSTFREIRPSSSATSNHWFETKIYFFMVVVSRIWMRKREMCRKVRGVAINQYYARRLKSEWFQFLSVNSILSFQYFVIKTGKYFTYSHSSISPSFSRKGLYNSNSLAESKIVRVKETFEL